MKKFLTTLILVLLANTLLFGAVAKNDSGTPNVTSAGSVGDLTLSTFTVTDPCANCCLIAILHNTGGTISSVSVTWNGVAMTSAGTVSSNTHETRIFYLIAPATGNQTLFADWTTNRSAELGAIAFSGADQSTCVNAADYVNPTGSGANPSTGAIVSTTDGATVGGATDVNSITATQAGATAIYRTGSFAASYAIGGTSNTHTWTASAGNWAAAGVHVLAASAGPPAGSLQLLGVGK